MAWGSSLERTLGLICGAGPLPARHAREARRQGFRVIALAFGDAPGLGAEADRLVRASLADLRSVLDVLQAEHVSAVLFGGKFWRQEIIRKPDAETRAEILARTGGVLSDAGLMDGALTLLHGFGIEVLDQRRFLGPWLAPEGRLGRHAVDVEHRADVLRGFAVARRLAEVGVGQTVVLRHGMVAAVEALEGTTEAIRRGLQLLGPGAVVVKAASADTDYRFDVPSVGPDTLEVMAAGGALALAVEAGRVAVLDLDRTVAVADRAGIALVSVDAAEPGT